MSATGKQDGNSPVKEPEIPSPDFSIKTGDSAPRINATLQNSGGTAVDIQGATVVFKAAPISGGTTIVAGTVTIDQVTDGSDGTLGMVHYNWTSTDTRTAGAGLFLGEFETVFAGGGGTETFPNSGFISILITSDL